MNTIFSKHNDERGFTHTPAKAGVSSRREGGFTLIEALVAIFIFSISLVSLLTITSRGISGTTSAANQSVAQFLAQEGIEVARNQRDSNIIAGTSTDIWNILDICDTNDPCDIEYSGNALTLERCATDPCRLNFDNGVYTTDPGDPTVFTRRIWTEPESSDEMRVYSQVSWQNGSLTRFITLSTTLTAWATQ